jgi:hypothetical protein
MLCLDVVQVICDFCDLVTQVRLIQSCRTYDENIKIRKLEITDEFSERISQIVLEQKKFNKLQYLDAIKGYKIRNLNHLKDTLLVLICYGHDCTIDQQAIAQLQRLTFLDCSHNRFISNVNHLKDTLETLACTWSSAIGQEGIKELRLKELNARNNSKITDVSHCKDTLTKLNCGWDCGITQQCIDDLNKLQALDAFDNAHIRNFSKLYELRYLAAGGVSYDLYHNDIKGLTKLKYIDSCSIRNGCMEVLYSALQFNPPKI